MSVRHALGRVRRIATRNKTSQVETHDTNGSAAAPVDRSADQWFWDHYEWAAGEVVAFLAEDGLTMTGADVADVGCGDGITDLGLAQRTQPRRLVGFDVNPVRQDLLVARAAAAGLGETLPASLEFQECSSEHLPAPDDSFDIVVSWSAFEHIDDPLSVLLEIRRILRPDGVFFLQVWPFYGSQHGAHLDEWYPAGFVQYQKLPETICAEVLEMADNKDWARYKLAEFEKLNQITIDDLGRALREARFSVAKLQLMHERVHIPPEVDDTDLSRLGISGVMLLAR